MNKTLLLICLLFNFISIHSQNEANSIQIKIQLQFKKTSIIPGEQYISEQKDTLSFNVIKFYLSDFEIHYKNTSVTKEKDSYHLIDFEHPETLNINLKKESDKDIEYLKFNIGIDSLASVSGALGGDLDATKGMYWSWQSGFINMKIEGRSTSCKTRKNAFQFHIGGYLKPNYAMRTKEIRVENFNSYVQLNLDLDKLFSEIKLKNTNAIMIPGKEAMKIANIVESIFSIE